MKICEIAKKNTFSYNSCAWIHAEPIAMKVESFQQSHETNLYSNIMLLSPRRAHQREQVQVSGAVARLFHGAKQLSQVSPVPKHLANRIFK